MRLYKAVSSLASFRQPDLGRRGRPTSGSNMLAYHSFLGVGSADMPGVRKVSAYCMSLVAVVAP